jgi:hypothetical protein
VAREPPRMSGGSNGHVSGSSIITVLCTLCFASRCRFYSGCKDTGFSGYIGFLNAVLVAIRIDLMPAG